MLRCIQGEEVESWEGAGQRVEVRGQAGGEAAPWGVEQNQCAVTAIGVEEVHQVLQASRRKARGQGSMARTRPWKETQEAANLPSFQ